MTGKLDRRRSTAPMPVHDVSEHFYTPEEPIAHVLGISDHWLARIDGNVHKISIRGERLA